MSQLTLPSCICQYQGELLHTKTYASLCVDYILRTLALSGQLWWGMPGCMRRLEDVSSISPWPADTWRSAFTCAGLRHMRQDTERMGNKLVLHYELVARMCALLRESRSRLSKTKEG